MCIRSERESHFERIPPDGQLYVLSRTFKFNPLDQTWACQQPMIGKARVPASLTRQFADLGDAEYLFDGYPGYSPATFRLPWKYTLVDAYPNVQPGEFHLVAFSRAAFNWDHKEALFAFSDACAASDCGRGGAIYARKEQETLDAGLRPLSASALAPLNYFAQNFTAKL